MILDDAGEPVWFRPLPHGVWATNLTSSSYRRQPVLTWWEGKVIAPGSGVGLPGGGPVDGTTALGVAQPGPHPGVGIE
jgi:hypothetical protein